MGDKTKIEWAEELTRFWLKVKVADANECWEWQAGLFSNGYGQYRVGKKKVKAHRFSYRIFYGKIPDGLCVCHICDNPKCVNPVHLFLGTHKDNSNDRDRKKRGCYNNCQPQPGAKNGSSKLNPNQVISILNFCASGISLEKISQAFNISKSQVRNIKHRRSWQCLQIPK